jgi:hypothetical protein
MKVSKLQLSLKKQKEAINKTSGFALYGSEKGPVGIDIIEDLITVIEELERRIIELENKSPQNNTTGNGIFRANFNHKGY